MIAKLTATGGVSRGLVLSFTEGERWTIGRNPDECDLIIEDAKVSRRHLLCRQVSEGYTLQNLSVTNPVFINDQELTEETLLHEGDRVKIGNSLFIFSSQEETAETIPSPETLKMMSEEEPEQHYETIFKEAESPTTTSALNLAPTGRWLLKVIAGPNSGAEISLESNHAYVLGTDSAVCDIVFYDLSVSRQHAKITVSAEDKVSIEDLQSRNGVLIEGKLIEAAHPLENNAIITIGTTSFIVIDREAAQATIPATIPPPTPPTPAEEAAADPLENSAEAKPLATTPEQAAAVAEKKRSLISGGSFILLVIALAIIVISVAGSLSLFKTKEVLIQPRDFNEEIQRTLSGFTDVRFMYNKTTGKLFILGHVLTGVEKSELMYNLKSLAFVTSIEDNVVVDESVWGEMNQILEENATWNGVSMYSPQPGRFVLTGYLQTQEQASSLDDFIRLNFTYLDRLDNQVVVEEVLLAEIISRLQTAGFFGVNPQLSTGDLALTGYIPQTKAPAFEELVSTLSKLRGIRILRNLVIVVAAEQSVIDLTGRYQVTGFSKLNEVNINVLINGKIMARGDVLDGMTIVSIQNKAIFLEKNGVKYKINYNQ